MKLMDLVTVTFDQTSEESVTAIVMRVYTQLDDSTLPALAKDSVFQKKMVDQLNENLKKALRHS